MARLIQCPETYDTTRPGRANEYAVFVAGGISGCVNWQKEMIQRFKDCDDTVVLINPRRENFDNTNPNESIFQIEWEHDHIKMSDAMIFWFPFETLCPITLYELGVAAARGNTIFVGCHPAYARMFDVEHQLSLIRPEIQVRDNFADVVEDVTEWLTSP
jgi:hypothetical protein